MKPFTITKRSEFPYCLRNIKAVAGICVGHCVCGDALGRELGHAHNFQPFQGWICLKYKFVLKQRKTLLHEAAHLLVDPYKDHHGKEWRKAVISIGGTYKRFGYRRTSGWYTIADFTYTRSGRSKEQ